MRRNRLNFITIHCPTLKTKNQNINPCLNDKIVEMESSYEYGKRFNINLL